MNAYKTTIVIYTKENPAFMTHADIIYEGHIAAYDEKEVPLEFVPETIRKLITKESKQCTA